MWITDWTTQAACKGTDPNELFVQGAAQNRAKLLCRGCPVRTECLADALDNGIEFGVWGGMTERERRALLRRRPDVTSWRDLLEPARGEYERQSIDELVAGDVSYSPPGWQAPSPVLVAGPSATPADSGQPEVPAAGIRKCCEAGYQPLFTFLILAGQTHPEARETAHRVLSEAYLRNGSGVSPLRLRQMGQVRLQHGSMPEAEPPAVSPAFLDCVSISSRRVLELVADLPEPQRLALAWATGGYSPAEMAKGSGLPLAAVLESLQCARDALMHDLGLGPQGEPNWEGDDGEGEADLDDVLMKVTDEIAEAVEPADITATAEAVMADARSGWSLLRLQRGGDMRATG